MHKILLLTLSFVFLNANLAAAQLKLKPSTPEDIAVAFYKVGATIPDFDLWIKKYGPYNTAPWAMRGKIYKDEKIRLVEKYQSFTPKNNLIRIRTKFEIGFENFIETTPQGDVTHHILKTGFLDTADKQYFPYEFIGQNISVIPINIKEYASAIVSEKEYQLIHSKLNGVGKIKAYIELQAINADHEKPKLVDGIDQWALFSNIISIILIDDNSNIVWEKNAPWYVSPTTESLNELYDGQYKK